MQVFDLAAGLILNLVACALAFWGSARLARNASRVMTIAALLAVLVFTGYFVVYYQGRLELAELLPFSNVILLANWAPFGVAFLAGLLWAQPHIPRSRRNVLLAGALAIGLFSLARPLAPLMNPPRSAANVWTSDGVALQSNASSCSACAAAMLLREAGISADEGEMMALCLTGDSGSPTLGLYRGLKIKAAQQSLAVEPIDCTLAELLEEQPWPALLLVRLEKDFTGDLRYEQQWGWTPGVGHAVVVFGQIDQDRLEVGDPSIGREEWLVEDLEVLWGGQGLRLVQPH